MNSLTFPKKEKLCSDRLIRLLYESGNTFVEFPFRVKTLWVKSLYKSNPQILISAPIKKFKKAITRNLIKRRIREAYRLNKSILLTLNLSTINPSTYQPINPSTHQPINPSTHQPINPSTYQPINPSTHQPINPSTHQPINHSPSNLLIGIYYIANEILDFEIIQKKLILVIEHIKKNDFSTIDTSH